MPQSISGCSTRIHSPPTRTNVVRLVRRVEARPGRRRPCRPLRATASCGLTATTPNSVIAVRISSRCAGVAAEDAHHRVRGVVLHAPDLEGEHLELAVEVHHLVHDVRHHERVDEVALDLDVFVWRVGHVASRGLAALMRRSGPPGPARPASLPRAAGRRRPRRPLTPPRPVPIVGAHGSGAWRRRSIRTRGNSMTARTRPAGLLVKASMVLILLLVLAAAVGVARAAASSSPVPGREGHAAHRHGAGARQPEPVHRHPGHRLHVLAHELRLPRRLRLQDARAAARARHRVGGLRRTARSGPSPSARDPRGRTASRSRRATSRSPSTTSSTTSS